MDASIGGKGDWLMQGYTKKQVYQTLLENKYGASVKFMMGDVKQIPTLPFIFYRRAEDNGDLRRDNTIHLHYVTVQVIFFSENAGDGIDELIAKKFDGRLIDMQRFDADSDAFFRTYEFTIVSDWKW